MISMGEMSSGFIQVTDGVEAIEKPKPENILEEANRLINGNRNDDYGHPYHDFSRSAKMWSAIIGAPVSASDVALCMMAVKMSREVNKPKRDNIVDIAGYAGCLEKVREYEADLLEKSDDPF